MNKSKTVRERVDEVVVDVAEKIDKAKGKLVTAKKEVADIAHDISKSVKKAVGDSGEAVTELFAHTPEPKKKSAPAHAPAKHKSVQKKRKAS